MLKRDCIHQWLRKGFLPKLGKSEGEGGRGGENPTLRLGKRGEGQLVRPGHKTKGQGGKPYFTGPA